MSSMLFYPERAVGSNPSPTITTTTLHFTNMSMQYTAIFTAVKIGVSVEKKKFDNFLILAQNIGLGYT